MSALNTALMCAGPLPAPSPRTREMSTTTRLALMCAGVIPVQQTSCNPKPEAAAEKPMRSPMQAQILVAMRQRGGRATHRELLDELGCKKNSLYLALARMRAKGLIKHKSDARVRYHEVVK